MHTSYSYVQELTCAALPVEVAENEKAAKYDENVEDRDEHGCHGLSPIMLKIVVNVTYLSLSFLWVRATREGVSICVYLSPAQSARLSDQLLDSVRTHRIYRDNVLSRGFSLHLPEDSCHCPEVCIYKSTLCRTIHSLSRSYYALHIDLERDTSRGHSCQAGTTQTFGAVGLVWILRGLIESLENGAFADGHWRC